VQVANIAQTINVLQAMILTEGGKMLLTPTYHVFEMYKVHQDATLLPTSVQSDEYVHQHTRLPARRLVPGYPGHLTSTPQVSASASLSMLRARSHLSLCNLHHAEGDRSRMRLPRRGHFIRQRVAS